MTDSAQRAENLKASKTSMYCAKYNMIDQASTPLLSVGDILLTINGVNVLDLPHTQVVRVAQKCKYKQSDLLEVLSQKKTVKTTSKDN